jgi:pimeloyl-ACP methyl ester carboxylesterase
MAPVARELAADRGVLEPLQTAATLEGQVRELRAVLTEHAALPATLIGWSWGAMLGFIFTARYPAVVRKLILISSGPFQEPYAAGIKAARLQRLDPEKRMEAESLTAALDDPTARGKDAALTRLGDLFTMADTCDPLQPVGGDLPAQYRVNRAVWPQAAALRRDGRLLAMGRQIMCPVVAIHGDYDPIPPPECRNRSPQCCAISASSCSGTAGTCPGWNARPKTRSSRFW